MMLQYYEPKGTDYAALGIQADSTYRYLREKSNSSGADKLTVSIHQAASIIADLGIANRNGDYVYAAEQYLAGKHDLILGIISQGFTLPDTEIIIEV